MSASLLEELAAEEFAIRLAFLSTPSALRACLRKTPEVNEVIQALGQGVITEEGIRAFVSVLLEDLRVGERLPHEIAIAALAVALETRPTNFAEEFLRDLSSLRLAEMGLAIRVANECRKRRVSIAQHTSRDFDLRLSDKGQMRFFVVASESTFQENGSRFDNTTVECEVA